MLKLLMVLGLSIIVVLDKGSFRFLLVAEILLVGTILLWLIQALGRRRAEPRAFYANWALLGGSLLVGLIFAEAATRGLFSDVTTTGSNQGYFSERWRATDRPRRNALGFRERDIERANTGARFHVMVIGDSFTYGQGISEDHRYTNRVEAALRREDEGFRVLNFGRAGTETIDHLQILRDVVIPLHPNFLLLQWYVNDMEGHDKGSRPQAFSLIPLRRIDQFLQRYSAFYFLIDDGFRRMQEAVGLIDSYPDYVLQRFGDADGRDLREYLSSLAEFFDLARKNTLPMGVLIFPDLIVNLASEYKLGFLLDRVVEFCRQHDVTCVDLRPYFDDIEDVASLHVNRFDHHPSAGAHAIAAQAVLDTFAPAWKAMAARPRPAEIAGPQ